MWGHRRNGLSTHNGAIGADYQKWLRGHCALLTPRWIFYESPFMGKDSAVALRLYGLEMVTLMVAHEFNTPAHKVVSSTMMKFFSGFGRWPKGEKKAASMRMAEAFGWKVQTDDESDALGILLYGESRVAPRLSRSSGVLFSQTA
jgi:Holliday junction resolvasome RuvABC endonuclease subunit